MIYGSTAYFSGFDYTTTLTGENTYQGSTKIFNNATLVLDGGDNRLPTSTPVVIQGGGTLDLNGWTQTIASLSTTLTYTHASYVNLSSGTLIVGDNNDTEFHGVISGPGTLFKQGSGSLALDAIDNASIQVNEGTLVIDDTPLYDCNLANVELANAPGAILSIASGSAVSIASLNGGGENGGVVEIESYSVDLCVLSGNFGGTITGEGGFKKQGSGIFELSGFCSAYSVNINEGVMQLNGDDRIAFDTSLNLRVATYPVPGDSAIFDLNGFNQSCRTLDTSADSFVQLGGGTLSVGNGYVSGVIKGEGNLVKIDSETSYNKLNLYGDNTYSGTASVLSGTLNIVGSLANNGSDKIFLAADDTVFDATITRSIGIDASYAGFGSTAIGDNALGTSADLIDGINTETSKSLSMQWRLRDGDELAAGLVSDVLNLSGMANEEGEPTDWFTLQMSYSADALPGGAEAETLLADAGEIQLVWFNDTESLWQNAALANFGTENDVQFMGVGYAPDGVLGHWGIDVSTHTVWAVLDHNSQFAVAVPEPGTIAMLIAAMLSLAVVGYRRAF